MAPTAKIETKRPGTLPADFGEWDSGEIPATLPDNFDGFDTAPEPSAAKTVAARHGLGQASGLIPVDRSPQGKSPMPSASLAGAKTAVTLARTSELDVEQLPAVGKVNRKMKVRFIAVGSLLLLVVIASMMFFRPRQNSTSQKPAVVARPLPAAAPMKPSPGAAALPTITPREPMPPAVSDSKVEAPSSRVQPDMMNNQLAAPTRISRDINRGQEQQAPPLNVAGIETMGSNNGEALKSVFSGKGPQVKSDNKIVNISAGVATGLLLQKATPVYPAIAKSAHVGGTVVLTATISKTGMIENLRVVSGSLMLRQAALDAVKNWRYKPYLLNNQPVDVATTVSVIFSLGKG